MLPYVQNILRFSIYNHLLYQVQPYFWDLLSYWILNVLLCMFWNVSMQWFLCVIVFNGN